MSFNFSLHLSEKEIINNLLLGGSHRRKAEEKLFSSYSYFIREAARKYPLSNEDAFDAYSDTILLTIEKIINKSFEGRSSLKTYVYQIFKNKCIDILRRNETNMNKIHRTLSITDMVNYFSDATKSIIQKMVEKSELDALLSKFDELGDKCRQLLLLSADGYNDTEIAVFLKYKTTAVAKTTRLRCIERLRKIL